MPLLLQSRVGGVGSKAQPLRPTLPIPRPKKSKSMEGFRLSPHLVSTMRQSSRSQGVSLLPSSTSSIASESIISDASSCPYSRLRSALGLAAASAPQAPDGYALRLEPGLPAVEYPGPSTPAAYLADMLALARDGIESASLRFALSYGEICRFPNPAGLGGATGWTFLCSPRLVEHCCATKARNFSARFLPDAYSWVTHSLGILGSSGPYNRAQRKLCGPPFAAAARGSESMGAAIVVQRAAMLGDVCGAAGPFECDVAVLIQVRSRHLNFVAPRLMPASHEHPLRAFSQSAPLRALSLLHSASPSTSLGSWPSRMTLASSRPWP